MMDISHKTFFGVNDNKYVSRLPTHSEARRLPGTISQLEYSEEHIVCHYADHEESAIGSVHN